MHDRRNTDAPMRMRQRQIADLKPFFRSPLLSINYLSHSPFIAPNHTYHEGRLSSASMASRSVSRIFRPNVSACRNPVTQVAR